MHVFTTHSGLTSYLSAFQDSSLTIGCVPTMGALHKGHMALMQKAKSETDLVVATIFVNPTQFNEKADLTNYPKPLAKDIGMLEAAEVDVLFLPTESVVYPPDFEAVQVDLAGLDLVMEGKFRPGHFAGVVTVVHRLLELVEPNRLYMGLKDYQQQAIISHMIEALRLEVDLIPCPIVREDDGLAYSSRNARLTTKHRQIASSIHNVLLKCKQKCASDPVKEVRVWAIDALNSAGFRTEYVEFVDGKTLQSIDRMDDHSLVIACVASWLGEVRLIDNMVMKGRL
ncbi:MAG: pantoate--beta-alanine ligase [Saprospiraceae bacterium]|nr:pantoate--beta-alanine ligase [Saprospiraceae bacterium]